MTAASVEAVAWAWARVRDGGGRLFYLGLGFRQVHPAHAVNDAKNLRFEAYTPARQRVELPRA